MEEGACFFTMELLDGADLVTFVRGKEARRRPVVPQGPWIERLEAALLQLVRGVSALHRAGKLHRDIKPSNVRVTSAGRVVLLDFGLAVGLEAQSAESALVGTPAYMPPEQAWGKQLAPAADWYGVGVVLYEALTGELPFRGALLDMIDDKQRHDTRPPSRVAAGVPPVFDDLVMALLHPNPAQRATGKDILGLLQGLGAGDPQSASPSRRPVTPFVGRDAELRALTAAYQRAASGSLTVVRVEGASGMGKSELVRRFVGRLEAEEPCLVFRGRCHPQESVPYKAFDALVDELSRHLVDLDRAQVEALSVPHLGALVRIFPVLGRVEAFSTTRAAEGDPHEIRRQGFEGLGELFSRLGAQMPIVLWIDDLQWIDADSGILLSDLLRVMEGRILLLLASRIEDVQQNPALRALTETAIAAPFETITVGPLGEADTRQLAERLLGGAGGDGAIAEIVAESAGSPFFVGELARYDLSEPSPAQPISSRQARPDRPGSALAGVLLARIDRLSPAELRVLEIVSTAGGPVNRSLVLEAAGLGEPGRPDVLRLAHRCLVRTTEIGGQPAIETYHDKVRESLLQSLAPEQLRRCHQQLADALRAQPSPDPEALVIHCLGAGDRSSAAHYAVEAADRAAAALAFERAGDLYRKALDLGAPNRSVLYERLGESLVNAGRGAESPPHFLAAAKTRSSEPEAAAALHRQAAEQLVRTGRLEEGLAIFRHIFAEVGLRMPASVGEANLRIAIGLIRLLARGIAFRERDPAEIPERVRRRLDALWGACSALGVMDAPRASALAIQHLTEALDAGDRSRIAHGLCHEAVLEAAIGGRRLNERALRLLAAADALIVGSTDPNLRAFAITTRGSVAWHQGRFEDAYRWSDEGARAYAAEGRGAAFHRVGSENYALSALAFLGDMKTLSAQRAESHRRAQGWGDAFGTALFQVGQLNLARIAEDDPEKAIREADSIGVDWPLRHYHHTVITVQADLYRGDMESASRRIEDAWPGLQKERLLGLEFPRIELHYLRARAALATAEGAGRSARWWLVRKVHGSTRVIGKSGLLPAGPFRASLLAGVAWIQGDRKAAAARIAEAARGFTDAKMRIYEEAHRMALEIVEGAGGGAADRMRALGVQSPERMARMVVPWLRAG
ncbi:MAG: AAA family ATPase [Minicystis sp.]